ncbi:polysaccharide pyruvyl transferase family protein [Seonamhaeicola sp. ML3]|uniref:polysaccharide pyruvyl transferase family protein n=1 Tax=Seonamhaeicola sp. ML3 TaxID=2937786 RepID=UPI00200C1D7C|nr:polysaccharide pyruvyl transferase family protein [Seonamhaeicola sp. ML3]
MINIIKKIIPLELKFKVRLLLLKLKPTNGLGLSSNSSKVKRIYIFLSADYGNLGDVAITYAQHKFLKEKYPDFLVTEIPISNTLNGIEFVKRKINKTDIVTTVGGGNMGDLYPMIELFRQLVIENFKDNPIIAFPQTADFEHSSALKKAIKRYSKHKNLTLIAREQKTFEFFKTYFDKNNILLTPDIVLSLDKVKPLRTRKGAIICLRDDKEKKLTQDQDNVLKTIIEDNFETFKHRDTHIGGENLSLFNRVKALHLIWDDFKSAELIITDRLHGMIFSYITGTPALVFLNNNHKVKSSYHWINSASHIKLVDEFSVENIKKSINELKKIDNVTQLKNMSHLYNVIVK